VPLTFLWIPATLAATVAQTARNAIQRHLTAELGTVGATQVRFLFGFPFSLIFLAAVMFISGERMPPFDFAYVGFVLAGGVSQIIATILMLAAMREQSFSVAIAYTKTEPVQVAVFGLAVLGDPLSVWGVLAILIATAGVVVLSVKPGREGELVARARPALYGVASGAFFALAAIGFRGGILALPEGSFVMRATTTLVWSLGAQSLILFIYMAFRDRRALVASLRAWRFSLTGGFMGALASQFWFIGFALTAAANVRTLALVEVIFAQAISRRLFDHTTTARELIGLGLVVFGVGMLLLFAH
jgi:drug/metabolite transporter (DMT)-like permease